VLRIFGDTYTVKLGVGYLMGLGLDTGLYENSLHAELLPVESDKRLLEVAHFILGLLVKL
jgi:hypothetical protein